MRLFGLIGYPLSHSFSKKHFTEKFEKENVRDAQYELYPLQSISEIRNLLMSSQHIVGLNITIPYKQEIIPLLDEIHPTAKSIGAVNCVKVIRENTRSYKLLGYNTDEYGFEKSLTPHIQSHHTSALILGSGGASKAAKYVLDKLQIKSTVVSRKEKQPNEHITYNDITKQYIEGNLLIINCTPLGMYPNINEYPDIPYQYITSKHLLFDMIYNPLETNFLLKGRQMGAKTINGIQMLNLQADKSWEVWNEN